MQLKIDHNVPLPARAHKRGRQPSQETQLALKMKPGDSILCPDRAIYRRITKALSNNKRAYVSRLTEEGYRVWRVDGRKSPKDLYHRFAISGEARANGRVAPTL